MNKRIQRKRTKGWIKPDNAIYVGRPTKWGNPYKIDWNNTTLDYLLLKYKLWLEQKLRENPHFLDELKGKDLMCWCPLTKPCHADILLEYLNKNNHRMDEYGKT